MRTRKEETKTTPLFVGFSSTNTWLNLLRCISAFTPRLQVLGHVKATSLFITWHSGMTGNVTGNDSCIYLHQVGGTSLPCSTCTFPGERPSFLSLNQPLLPPWPWIHSGCVTTSTLIFYAALELSSSSLSFGCHLPIILWEVMVFNLLCMFHSDLRCIQLENF